MKLGYLENRASFEDSINVFTLFVTVVGKHFVEYKWNGMKAPTINFYNGENKDAVHVRRVCEVSRRLHCTFVFRHRLTQLEGRSVKDG